MPRQSTNDKAELQEQPRADDVDEEREMTHRTGKNESIIPAMFIVVATVPVTC